MHVPMCRCADAPGVGFVPPAAAMEGRPLMGIPQSRPPSDHNLQNKFGAHMRNAYGARVSPRLMHGACARRRARLAAAPGRGSNFGLSQAGRR